LSEKKKLGSNPSKKRNQKTKDKTNTDPVPAMKSLLQKKSKEETTSQRIRERKREGCLQAEEALTNKR